MVDTLLAAKQATLQVSAVAGSSLLGSSSVLKRVAVSGTGLSITDSGHALTITQDLSTKQDLLSVNASAGGIPVIDITHTKQQEKSTRQETQLYS